MSTTTTTTTVAEARPTALQSVLQDYRLHHSEASGDAAKSPESSNRASSSAIAAPSQPPPAWDNVPHRRVPPYRPTNRDRDQAETSVYLNGIERTFITTMFAGLFVNASAAKLWHGTVGRVNDNIFKYSVGGER